MLPWLVLLWQWLSDVFRPGRLTRLAVRRDGRHCSVPVLRTHSSAFAPAELPRRPLSADRTKIPVVTLVSFLRPALVAVGMPLVLARAMVAFFARGTALGPCPQTGRPEDVLSGG